MSISFIPWITLQKKKLEKLENEFLKIRVRLDDLCNLGQITEYEKCSIVQLSEIVISKITQNYEQIQKGVCSIMGGNVLDYEAKRILNRGIDVGRREGKIEGQREGLRQGKIDALVDLIHDGLLSVSEAAKRLDMDESDFQKYL